MGKVHGLKPLRRGQHAARHSRKMQDLGKIEAAADSSNHRTRSLRGGMQSAKDRPVSHAVEDNYGRID